LTACIKSGSSCITFSRINLCLNVLENSFDLKQNSPESYFNGLIQELFSSTFRHKFILEKVIQDEPDLIQAVNDVSKGNLPTETYNLLRWLLATPNITALKIPSQCTSTLI
jgi:hypothetical protein